MDKNTFETSKHMQHQLQVRTGENTHAMQWAAPNLYVGTIQNFHVSMQRMREVEEAMKPRGSDQQWSSQ